VLFKAGQGLEDILHDEVCEDDGEDNDEGKSNGLISVPGPFSADLLIELSLGIISAVAFKQTNSTSSQGLISIDFL